MWNTIGSILTSRDFCSSCEGIERSSRSSAMEGLGVLVVVITLDRRAAVEKKVLRDERLC
jgi:hypothetical protein